MRRKLIRSTFRRSEVNLDLAGGLGRINVKDHPALAADVARRRCPGITPISLFTNITEARMVSGRMAARKASRSSRPLSCGSGR